MKIGLNHAEAVAATGHPEATRRAFLGASLLAAAGACGGALAMPRAATARWLPRRQPGADGLAWTEVREGVWVATGGGGNSMLALGAGEALLVDTKVATFGPSLARLARSRAPRLAMVINTHHHADHTGGNFAFTTAPEDLSGGRRPPEEPGRPWQAPRLVAHEKAAPRIRAQRASYLEQVRSALSGAGLAPEIQEDLERTRGRLDELDEHAWAPGETVGPGAEWTIGGDGAAALKVEVRHFGPGHTDNDIVVRLPGRNVLHAGDLLFHAMHPYFDPPGGATCRGWLESVRRAIELCDDSTVVIPGHGEVTDVEGLRRQADYLEKLWEAVGALVDEGASRADAVQKVWPFMEGLGRPQLRERAIGAVFDERSK